MKPTDRCLLELQNSAHLRFNSLTHLTARINISSTIHLIYHQNMGLVPAGYLFLLDHRQFLFYSNVFYNVIVYRLLLNLSKLKLFNKINVFVGVYQNILYLYISFCINIGILQEYIFERALYIFSLLSFKQYQLFLFFTLICIPLQSVLNCVVHLAL